MFNTTHIDLGIVRVGEVRSLEYDYDENTLVISITTTCVCTGARDVRDEHKIVVGFKAKPIPIHIKKAERDQYTVTKGIQVVYTSKIDGTTSPITLTFTAIIRG